LRDGDEKIYLICFSGLIDWYDFREAYNDAQEYWYALTKIYPRKNAFSMNELAFAKSCQKIVRRRASEQYIKRITPLLRPENPAGLIDTLLVYLLDAGSNVRETARILSFHENSIKYRLKSIREQIRFDVNKMPDAYELYLSAALYRLYNQS
jgi:DNA-binding PucR family transcriptional regulator